MLRSLVGSEMCIRDREVLYQHHLPSIMTLNRYFSVVWYTVGFPGNLLSLAVWIQPRMRHSSGCYLAALAAADFIFLSPHHHRHLLYQKALTRGRTNHYRTLRTGTCSPAGICLKSTSSAGVGRTGTNNIIMTVAHMELKVTVIERGQRSKRGRSDLE